MNGSTANRILFVLSLAGCADQLYLTYEYAHGASIYCGPGENGCNAVRDDAFAFGLGIPALHAIPTPAFGLAMYVTLAALSMARVFKPSITQVARNAQWVITALGVVVSAYLTWREYAVIHAWCKWCVAQAIIITLMFLVASAERLSSSRPGGASLEAA